jgi:hypothetical protein
MKFGVFPAKIGGERQRDGWAGLGRQGQAVVLENAGYQCGK